MDDVIANVIVAPPQQDKSPMTSRIACLKLSAVALVLPATAALAVPSPRSLPKRIDELIQPYVAAAQFNGVVLVRERGKTIFSKAYGMANYELNVPNTVGTRFKIASLSKPVTDAALGILLDEKKISMDTRVSDVIPDFPNGNKITVRLLAEHRSGIPHTNNLPEYDNAARMSLAQSVAILKTKPLDFEPGTKTQYSNGGFDVLGLMIEKAAGMPFETFVQTAVLDKLGMKDTGVAKTYRVIPRLADGYQPGDMLGVRARSRFYPVEIRPSGGALYSTAKDMATFLRAAYSGKLLSAQTTLEIFGPKDRTYGPMGRSPGVSAITFADPGHDIYVVALANNYTSVTALGRRLYQAALNQPMGTEKLVYTDRRLDPKESKFFDGDYVFEAFGPSSRFKLAVQSDGRLVSVSRYDEPTILVPLADGRWFYPLFDVICTTQGEARLESMVCKSPLKVGSQTFRVVRVLSSESRPQVK